MFLFAFNKSTQNLIKIIIFIVKSRRFLQSKSEYNICFYLHCSLYFVLFHNLMFFMLLNKREIYEFYLK